MNDATNGATAPKVLKPEEQLEGLVRQTIGLLVRGLLVSTPGMPADLVLKAVCRQTGNLCAGSIQGNLTDVLMVRKGFKEAFHEGVASAPTVTPGMPAGAAIPGSAR